MSTSAPAGRNLFLNLPVADLQASKAFFGEVGFGFDPRFESESSACMPIGEQAFAILLGPERFPERARPAIGDPATQAIAHYCFSVGSREEVDSMADAALAAGGTDGGDPEDHGFMRSRSFRDLDGHVWDVMWMDPAAITG